MNNFTKLFGIITLVAVIGFSMACGDGGGGNPSPGNPQKVTYTGTSGGQTYTLIPKKPRGIRRKTETPMS